MTMLRPDNACANRSEKAISEIQAKVSRAAVWTAFGLLVALTSVSGVCAQPAAATEYEVKAAYLYNFGLFVSWPAGDRKSPQPFGICVLGKDPFGPALDSTFAGEVLDGRATSVRRIADPRDALSCGILYISQSEAKNLNAILSGLGKAAILTVSDIPNFSRSGGMIQFVWDGDNVRFEVNLTAAESAGLTLSSDLLKVATAVRKDSHNGM